MIESLRRHPPYTPHVPEPPQQGGQVRGDNIYYNGVLIGHMRLSDGRIVGVGGDPQVQKRAEQIHKEHFRRLRKQEAKAARAVLGLD